MGIGLSNAKTTSKLKLSTADTLPQSKGFDQDASLTHLGRAARVASIGATRIYGAPRLVTHFGMIALISGVVLAGSTGHPAKLNPLANQIGFGSVLNQAAAADVAANVADQTQLLVTHEVDTTAKTLNEQVSLPTSDDDTLAKRHVADTAGAATRGVTTYIVQAGDTLGGISTQFNITSDTIRWANGVANENDLKPGQSLKILPISGVQYTVKAGDTPDSIAQHFSANADQIVAFNNSEVSGLQVGQSIIVPDGTIAEAAPVATAPAVAKAAATQQPIHTFRGGANGYAYGYCTWYVASRRAVPGWWGNAYSWYGNARISGYGVGSTPQVGAIAWTGGGYYGHVAYVESVNGGMVTVSEMNWNGNWNRVTYRTVSASTFRYIY